MYSFTVNPRRLKTLVGYFCLKESVKYFLRERKICAIWLFSELVFHSILLQSLHNLDCCEYYCYPQSVLCVLCLMALCCKNKCGGRWGQDFVSLLHFFWWVFFWVVFFFFPTVRYLLIIWSYCVHNFSVLNTWWLSILFQHLFSTGGKVRNGGSLENMSFDDRNRVFLREGKESCRCWFFCFVFVWVFHGVGFYLFIYLFIWRGMC